MNNVLELKGKRFVQASKQGSRNGISMNSKKLVTIEQLIRLIDKLHQIKSFWKHEKKPFEGVLISVYYNKIVAKSNRIAGLLKGKDSNFAIVGAKFNAEKNKHIITYFVDISDLDTSINLLSKSCDVMKAKFKDGITQIIFKNDELFFNKIKFEKFGLPKTIIKNGIVTVDKTEADIVREIAKQYLGGSSLKTIAGGLTLRTIEYMPGKSDWNKSRIRRMIDDTRYIGNNGYPPILTEQEYSAMQAFKSQKNTQKNIDHSDNIFKLNAPVVCANCGGRMQRRIDNRRKTITRWRCTECKTSVNISDEDMLGGITELLNEVIADPESIQIPKSDYEESQEIKRLNAEISKELNTVGFDNSSNNISI